MKVIAKNAAKCLLCKEDIMRMGAEKAHDTMHKNMGGPFGAVIVKDGEIISIASNTVLCDNDPTAHAEVNAIREACRKLGTYDLSGCEIYATGSPCPMCLSAIIWANIKKVYISGLPADADEIGFRDAFIYKFIEGKCSDSEVLEIEKLDRSIAQNLYEDYAKSEKTVY